MKKIITIFVTFTFFLNSIFAISDAILIFNETTSMKIKNNQIYDDYELSATIDTEGNISFIDDEKSEIFAKIWEDKKYITLKIIFKYPSEDEEYNDNTNNIPTENVVLYTFYKKTGFLTYYESPEKKNFFYEENGLIKKEICLKQDGSQDYATEYFYDNNNNNIIKEIDYDENDKQEYVTENVYDKRTNNIIKTIYYDNNNNLDGIEEFDPITKKRLSYSAYDEKGNIKFKINYDKDTGKEIDINNYSNSKIPEKWTFLKFNDINRYDLGDGYFLSTTFCQFWQVETSKSRKVDWNELYTAEIKRCYYNNSYSGYEYLEKILKDKKAINTSVTLCKENSKTYYCFSYTGDHKIDFNNCIEIKLIKKELDYVSFNKSGKGSGPFGFDIGMTYDEVKNACNGNELEHIADDRYYVKPANTHPMFEKYIVWISKKFGLYYIKALGQNIDTSEYGTEAKSQFNKLVSILEKKYGNFKKIDNIKSDYLWEDEKYWMQSLKDGARTYQAYWVAEPRDKYDGLYTIILGLENSNKNSTDEAYIWIEYEFLNHEDATDALNDVL